MKTLVVAPSNPDIPHAEAEAKYLVNRLGATLVNGEVTVESLLDAINGGSFELLWFAAHGDENGVHLYDSVLEGSHIAMIARRVGAEKIFINTCDSERVAEEIYSRVQIPIICTIAEIGDTSAYITARSFATDLSRGKTFEEAFNLSSGPVGFRLIPMANGNGRQHAAMYVQVERNRSEIYDLKNDVEELRRASNHRTYIDRQIQEQMRQYRFWLALQFVVVLFNLAGTVVVVVGIFNGW